MRYIGGCCSVAAALVAHLWIGGLLLFHNDIKLVEAARRRSHSTSQSRRSRKSSRSRSAVDTNRLIKKACNKSPAAEMAYRSIMSNPWLTRDEILKYLVLVLLGNTTKIGTSSMGVGTHLPLTPDFNNNSPFGLRYNASHQLIDPTSHQDQSMAEDDIWAYIGYNLPAKGALVIAPLSTDAVSVELSDGTDRGVKRDIRIFYCGANSNEVIDRRVRSTFEIFELGRTKTLRNSYQVWEINRELSYKVTLPRREMDLLPERLRLRNGSARYATTDGGPKFSPYTHKEFTNDKSNYSLVHVLFVKTKQGRRNAVDLYRFGDVLPVVLSRSDQESFKCSSLVHQSVAWRLDTDEMPRDPTVFKSVQNNIQITHPVPVQIGYLPVEFGTVEDRSREFVCVAKLTHATPDVEKYLEHVEELLLPYSVQAVTARRIIWPGTTGDLTKYQNVSPPQIGVDYNICDSSLY
eukprot:Lankesteria_metandrocarpae@DN6355_c0_g1_i1.p1